ncbi:MAG: hypothetical protein ACI8XM_000186 [Haloarculaceae archaeon]|jgi:hypothetical protein
MHEVEQAAFGLRLTLDGYIDEEEMKEYDEKVRAGADEQAGSFGVIADMRGATAMPEGSERTLKEMMAYCDEQGLERAAGVFESTTTAMQTQQVAENVNHADGNAIFIDASERDDWESLANEWVRDGVKPSDTL